MKQGLWITISLLMLLATQAVSALDINKMKVFPPASEGMVKYVLELPSQENEAEYQVQLIVGKTVETDAQNNYFFAGEIEQKTIVSRGFNFYVLDELGPMAGTLMAVDPEQPKVKRFISLSGEPYLVKYNSYIPLVVYVPEGVEVNYRVWFAGEQATMMAQ